MAKVSMVNREHKRLRVVQKYAEKRKHLKMILGNSSSTEEEIDAARQALQKLPRNSSPVRLHNRCRLTGRPHGYYRKFGMSRNVLRQAAMRGDIPGLVKASW